MTFDGFSSQWISAVSPLIYNEECSTDLSKRALLKRAPSYYLVGQFFTIPDHPQDSNMVFPFSHSLPTGIRPIGSYGLSFVDNTRSDSAVAELATQILRPDFLQEHWQKDRQLSELQRQNLDLARALMEMQHSNSVLSSHLSYSNQNSVWDMNRRLARLIDQIIDRSSTDVTPSQAIAELVSEIEAKEKEICNLKGSLREQQVVLEHRSHQLARMEGKHEMAKIPSGLTV
jgi:hypothetical protein